MPRKHLQNLSPFAKWLVQFAEERDATLTAIAHQAGIAPGTFRYLVIDQKRRPSLETCLRLSALSGRPTDELLALAGQVTGQSIDPYHPDRVKIIRIFDGLPPTGRSALLTVAITLDEVMQKDSGT